MYKKLDNLLLEREKYIDIINAGIRNNLYNDSFYHALNMTIQLNSKIDLLNELLSL